MFQIDSLRVLKTYSTLTPEICLIHSTFYHDLLRYLICVIWSARHSGSHVRLTGSHFGRSSRRRYDHLGKYRPRTNLRSPTKNLTCRRSSPILDMQPLCAGETRKLDVLMITSFFTVQDNAWRDGWNSYTKRRKDNNPKSSKYGLPNIRLKLSPIHPTTSLISNFRKVTW